MKPFFKYATPVHDPLVVEPDTDANGNPVFGTNWLRGKYYRVHPQDAKEWFILYQLESHRQRWAFAQGAGNGLCVTEAVAMGSFA